MTRILTLTNDSNAVSILDELKQRVCIYCKRFSYCRCGHLRCLEIWEESEEFNFKCENFKEKSKEQPSE